MVCKGVSRLHRVLQYNAADIQAERSTGRDVCAWGRMQIGFQMWDGASEGQKYNKAVSGDRSSGREISRTKKNKILGRQTPGEWWEQGGRPEQVHGEFQTKGLILHCSAPWAVINTSIRWEWECLPPTLHWCKALHKRQAMESWAKEGQVWAAETDEELVEAFARLAQMLGDGALELCVVIPGVRDGTIINTAYIL